MNNTKDYSLGVRKSNTKETFITNQKKTDESSIKETGIKSRQSNNVNACT